MKYLLVVVLFMYGCSKEDWCEDSRTRSDLDYCNCNIEKCKPSTFVPEEK